LLALSIILPILSNPATSYAAKNIEYKVLFFIPDETKPAGNIEKIFSEYGKEGWEYTGQVSLAGTTVFIIFKR